MPRLFSNCSSTKRSITSLKRRTWKNTQFFEKKHYVGAENKLFFSHNRATQSSNFFVKATELLEQLFDMLWCHVCCTYAVSTSAHHQEEEIPFRQWKYLAVRLFFLKLRGLITFQPKIHKVTWLLICNLSVIYKNLRSLYKHLVQREEFAFGHEETCLHDFSSHCQTRQFHDFSMSVHKLFSFFFRQALEHLWKNRQSSIVFSFSKECHAFDKKIFASQVCIKYYNTTSCSLVGFRKLFWSLFSN